MKKSNVNATKTNANVTMLTVRELYDIFVKSLLANNRIEKVNYSDAKTAPYCGLNAFSVNVKKSFYNVYMNELNATKCTTVDAKLTAVINACDTTKKQLRNRMIRFDMSDRDLLIKCIETVCA